MAYRKYHNKKVEVDGIKFDSKAEARRYQELRLLERAGKIKDLKCQPHFLLQDKFTYKGKTERKVEYIADFSYQEYTDDTKQLVRNVVEDVKGVKTEAYKLKRKWFLARYPLFDFREIM